MSFIPYKATLFSESDSNFAAGLVIDGLEKTSRPCNAALLVPVPERTVMNSKKNFQ